MNKAGLVFVGISIVVALLFMIPAFSMPKGTVDGAPGPGYFPIIISAIVLLLSVILGIVYLREDIKIFKRTENQKKNTPKLIISMIAILVYALLFSVLPFIPVTIVGIGFLNWLYGKKWIENIIFSVVFTLVLYFIFSKFLHVML
mgnify:CR=1 FL=1